MPNFDRKGPKGEGSMSGRAMGKCTNFGQSRKSAGGENAVVESLHQHHGNGNCHGAGHGHGAGHRHQHGCDNHQ